MNAMAALVDWLDCRCHRYCRRRDLPALTIIGPAKTARPTTIQLGQQQKRPICGVSNIRAVVGMALEKGLPYIGVAFMNGTTVSQLCVQKHTGKPHAKYQLVVNRLSFDGTVTPICWVKWKPGTWRTP